MQYERLKLLIGEKLEKVQNSSVLILGLGGVGGFALEALIRCGVNNLIIVDNDTIDITNLNRQIISSYENVGKLKVDEWEKRAKMINPQVNIVKVNKFITKDNMHELFNYSFLYAIDACDTITTKVEFIKWCLKYNKKFISCMGTGKKFHPEKLKVSYLDKTSYDPIAKRIRYLLRKENIKAKIPVLFSDEKAINTNSEVVASSIFVPSVAGIMSANYIFNLIIGDENENN